MASAVTSHSLVEYVAGKQIKTVCSEESYEAIKNRMHAQGDWLEFTDQYLHKQAVLKSTVVRYQELT